MSESLEGLSTCAEALLFFGNSIWGLTNNLLVKWGATSCVEALQFFPSILLVFVVRWSPSYGIFPHSGTIPSNYVWTFCIIVPRGICRRLRPAMAGEWQQLRLIISLLGPKIVDFARQNRRHNRWRWIRRQTLHLQRSRATLSLPTTQWTTSEQGLSIVSFTHQLINTTLIFGIFALLNLRCVHVERQTIMTTPHRLSSTNHDMNY